MSTRTRILSTVAIAAAFMLAAAAMPDSAHAWWWNNPPRSAPEVDPSTLSSAIALAMGGLAVLGDKLRRR